MTASHTNLAPVSPLFEEDLASIDQVVAGSKALAACAEVPFDVLAGADHRSADYTPVGRSPMQSLTL